jgi:hypothetical protein
VTHILSKIGGWTQFGLTLITQLSQSQPHGWAQWLTILASGAAAVGIHAASSTDGSK